MNDFSSLEKGDRVLFTIHPWRGDDPIRREKVVLDKTERCVKLGTPIFFGLMHVGITWVDSVDLKRRGVCRDFYNVEKI